MGNLLGLWSSVSPVFDQFPVAATVAPELASSLPPPLPLSAIKPEVLVYQRDLPGVKFEWTDPVDKFAHWMTSEQIISGTGQGCNVIFIIHGFMCTISGQWMHTMKDDIIRQETSPVTVLLIGWGGGADLWPWDYKQSAASVPVVGRWLAPYLSAVRDIYPDVYLHGIGHSLGAHALGISGRTSGPGVFNRISGLDPAGPSFERINHENRLRASDAHIVDVIHTDGYESGDVISWIDPINHFGTLIPLGTVDFYPNFGVARQPGTHEFDLTGSHKRAHELYSWSINHPGTMRTDRALASTPDYDKPVKEDKPAGVWGEMGYFYHNHTDHINFYMATTGRPPWVPANNSQ